MKIPELMLNYERALRLFRENENLQTRDAVQSALTEFYDYAKELEEQNERLARQLERERDERGDG